MILDVPATKHALRVFVSAASILPLIKSVTLAMIATQCRLLLLIVAPMFSHSTYPNFAVIAPIFFHKKRIKYMSSFRFSLLVQRILLLFIILVATVPMTF